ncbi:FecR family protein [Flavitalea flava]
MPEFELLLERFLQNDLDPAELSLFLNAVKEPENLDILRQVLGEKLQQRAYSGLSDKGEIDQMFRQMLVKAGQKGADTLSIQQEPSDKSTGRSFRSFRLFKRPAAAAAVFLILLGSGTFLWFNNHNSPLPVAVKVPAPEIKNDIEPGGNKAVLTLSDGSKVTLTGAANGTLAEQGNTHVVKLANGQLAYQAAGGANNAGAPGAPGKSPASILYNTMTTPKGGQYKLTLPDGTQVWLNASSSITYPTGFSGKERKVEMLGEAYFEVAPNAKMPFKVMTDGMEVDVFGTHFNVNAYRDETVKKTTLLEGAVKVLKGTDATLLKPGQQALCGGSGSNPGISLVEDADIEESVAWKNGLFSFNGADLPLIMRQLARWYDLEVKYEGPMPKRRFTGKVFRNLKLSETLKILELNQIHFRLEGNRLTVTT